jgi:hypothetical protein
MASELPRSTEAVPNTIPNFFAPNAPANRYNLFGTDHRQLSYLT